MDALLQAVGEAPVRGRVYLLGASWGA